MLRPTLQKEGNGYEKIAAPINGDELYCTMSRLYIMQMHPSVQAAGSYNPQSGVTTTIGLELMAQRCIQADMNDYTTLWVKMDRTKRFPKVKLI